MNKVFILSELLCLFWSASPFHPFVQCIPFSHYAAYFLVYPWKATTSASFPYKDKFVNALRKSANKLIPQLLNICGSKVSDELRLEIRHSLFKMVPICFFVKWDVTRDLFSSGTKRNYIYVYSKLRIPWPVQSWSMILQF